MLQEPITTSETEETPKRMLRMHPKEFALWLFIASIIMIFGSLTSAYIVRQAESDWYVFDLPNLFYISAVWIFGSSITAQLSYYFAKKDQINLSRTLLLITFVAGIVFLGMQYYGWVGLVNIQVYLVGNPSGSFVYIITGLHAFHLISGLIFLLIMVKNTYQNKVNSKNTLWLRMSITYWHFLGALWIYLLFFLMMNR